MSITTWKGYDRRSMVSEPGTNYRAQKNTLTMIGKGKSISHGGAPQATVGLPEDKLPTSIIAF